MLASEETAGRSIQALPFFHAKRKESEMAAMSQKMERTLRYILSKVEDARSHTFEEWLAEYSYTLDDEAVSYLAEVYAENKQGIVRGMYDGRTLNALEKRGYLRYWDDLEQERGNWIIRLIEPQVQVTND